MIILYHALIFLGAGFLAAWAISINELRFGDKTYDSRWVWLLVIVLMAGAFAIASIHV